MNEESRRLQEKLRAKLGSTVALAERARKAPLVSFETTADVLPGSEDLVSRVIASLERNGRRVGHVRGRETAGAGAPGAAPNLDAALGALNEAGKPYDVVVCEGFGYKPIPKILVSKRVEEAFSMGLPQVVAYVASKDAHALIPRFAPDDETAIARFIEETIIGGTDD